MTRTNADVALEFIQQVASGTIDDAILTPDFSAWTPTSGDQAGDDWRKSVTALSKILTEPLKKTPTGVTADGERVAIEVVSYGKLINGEEYVNNYHFLVIVRGGRVSKVKCYFNTALAAQKLGPLFAAAANSAE